MGEILHLCEGGRVFILSPLAAIYYYMLYPHPRSFIFSVKNKINRFTDIENRLVVAKGKRGGGGMEWEFGVSSCKLLHIEWISNKVLL